MLIDCKSLSDKMREEMKEEVSKLEIKPCLAVIKVGNDPASEAYVRNKQKACEEVGIETKTINYFEECVTTDNLVTMIKLLNEDKMVNGILVQFPLPKHIDESKVIAAISPDKDVDGLTPTNVARLWLNEPCIEPCTPKGIIAILDSIGFKYEGSDAVVLGRSNIVGKPIAKMLMDRGCTVTICHSKTKAPLRYTVKSDLIVSAVGEKCLVDRRKVGEWLKQVIIDVGINRYEDGVLCGDVDKALYDMDNLFITPVPGGVGPMTVTMLLKNTLECYYKQMNHEI